MTFVSLKLRPTVQADYTPTLNEAGISSSNLIRFRDGLTEKLGGWSRFYPNSLPGVMRDLHAWQDQNGKDYLSAGTTLTLSVILDGVLSNITPQTLVTNFAPNFSTVINTPTVTVIDPGVSNVTPFDTIFFNTPISIGGLILAGAYNITAILGTHSYSIIAAMNATATVTNGGAVPSFSVVLNSNIVQVTLNNHGQSVGDFFTFPIPTTVGGITISGSYPVSSVTSANIFTIATVDTATSTITGSMNGGNAQLVYYINIGPQPTGVGYGLGGYGLGGYGTGIVPAQQIGISIMATDWTEDNWGETLLANPKGGGIYQWEPNSGFVNAGLIPEAPIFNNGIFVAMPEQILVAYGSIRTGQVQDPLIIRWSDAEDFTNWTVSALTQAGSFHIPTGSKVVGGLQGPQSALLWTDIDVYAMQYLGPPLVFGFNKISSGCGLIGPHARAEMRGNIYWMSLGSFFVLGGGGVQTIPCPLWDVIFQDLDMTNQSKCIAAPNSGFDEMSFYYPSISGGTGECDKYVKLNINTLGSAMPSWDYGVLPRAAWIDKSVLGQPIGATPSSVIYQHETSPDADQQPLLASFTTGYFVLNEGQDIPFIDWFFPDMKWGTVSGNQNASVQITFNVVTYPNGTVTSFGPYTTTNQINSVVTRFRGREVSITFSSSDLGSWWRVGLPRFRVKADGRR